MIERRIRRSFFVAQAAIVFTVAVLTPPLFDAAFGNDPTPTIEMHRVDD